jgi:hypothetical protein
VTPFIRIPGFKDHLAAKARKRKEDRLTVFFLVSPRFSFSIGQEAGTTGQAGLADAIRQMVLKKIAFRVRSPAFRRKKHRVSG